MTPKLRFQVYAHHEDLNCKLDAEEFSERAAITADALLLTLPDPTPSDLMLQPINHEELVTAQLSDLFCKEIRSKLTRGSGLSFRF